MKMILKNLNALNRVVFFTNKNNLLNGFSRSLSNGPLKGEPEQPIVKTLIPGPKSISLIKELSKIQVFKYTLFCM